MIVSCEILFDQNASGTFYAGQVMRGTVILKATAPKVVKAVLLKINGFAKTKFFNSGQRRQYHGREDYVTSLTYLLGSENSHKCTIEIGEHVYNFESYLPQTCPTSYEGHFGSIRYVASVIIKRPWKFDQTHARGFTVLNQLDLNENAAEFKIPVNLEALKTFCCSLSDTLKMEVNLPQTGFVPGQNIPVHALVINNSGVYISAVKMALIMLIRYESEAPHKDFHRERICLTKVKGDEVIRNCTRAFSRELLVPATPPSSMNFSKLIQLSYMVEVRAKTGNWHADHVITVPVTIGSVPLWNELWPQPLPPNSNSGAAEASGINLQEDTEASGEKGGVDSEKPTAEQVTSRGSGDQNFALPSYEEAVHSVSCNINEDEVHAAPSVAFAPLYPFYKQPTEQQGRCDSQAASTDKRTIKGQEN